MEEYLFQKQTYEIIGAGMSVHGELGCGFLEAVYQEALEIELLERGHPFQAQMPIRIRYKGQPIQKRYVADLLCFDNIIVELKAISYLGGNEEAQVLNYLKATGVRVGLLINFGKTRLEWKRLIR